MKKKWQRGAWSAQSPDIWFLQSLARLFGAGEATA